MEKNMLQFDKNKKENIKEKIERIYNELNIEYNYIEFDDQDVNHGLTLQASGKVKPINKIDAFAYIEIVDQTYNLMLLNVWQINQDDDMRHVFEVINRVNSELSDGRFSVTDKVNDRIVYYRNTVSCGDNFKLLDENLVQNQILIAMSGVVKLLESRNEITNGK